MNVKQYVSISAKHLADISSSANLDAELLLAAVLHCSRAALHCDSSRQLTVFEQQQFENFLQRRLQREPIAYILGTKSFYTLELKVTQAVFIPRPETEIVVETALRLLPSQKMIWLADLGTGSGAIALALAKERPAWQIVATENSPAALAVAQENAATLTLNNVHFYQGEWCAALPHRKFAAIMSNPPYIAAHEPELADLHYEPRSALVADAWGLAELAKIVYQARHDLQNQGWLILEHGYQQGAAVRALLYRAGYEEIDTTSDLAYHERCSYGQWVALQSGDK